MDASRDNLLNTCLYSYGGWAEFIVMQGTSLFVTVGLCLVNIAQMRICVCCFTFIVKNILHDVHKINGT